MLPARDRREPAEDAVSIGPASLNGPEPDSPASRRRKTSREAAYAALTALSACMQGDTELPIFFGRLGHAVSGLVGARRVAFWRLGPGGVLSVQPEPYGFPAASPIRTLRLALADDGGVAERAFFPDAAVLTAGTSPELDRLWRHHGVSGIRNSIAVPWYVGDRRLGAVAAYNARSGFTDEDAWRLRLVAWAAGVVWRYREAEEELGATTNRLELAVAARQRLLGNVAAGGDEARRRFASVLHDDSLQLLTAAELQLERMRNDINGTARVEQLEALGLTLRKVEDSLRTLLTNVSPEALDVPVVLSEAIRERLESLRVRAGIEPDVDLRLDGVLPSDVESTVFKNVAEALNNVEKHAHATRVRVSVQVIDGGVEVEVADNGTGFVVTETLYLPGHLGLVAIRERTQLAGGWCRIQSEPGAGARVEFWVPAGR